MLELAFPHKEALNKAWQACIFIEKFKYYNCAPEFHYEIEIDANSWDRLQMVSVDEKGSIQGYFSASIDHRTNNVTNVGAINFKGEISLEFSRDFKNFLARLFDLHKYNKVEWYVAIGNPAEAMYNRIIERYGGKTTGIKRASVLLYDGTLCDIKEYEIMRGDYIQARARDKEGDCEHTG